MEEMVAAPRSSATSSATARTGRARTRQVDIAKRLFAAIGIARYDTPMRQRAMPGAVALR